MKIKTLTELTGFSLILLTTVLLFSCYEGFTGPEGEMLLKYLEPQALKELTLNPQENIWIIDVRPASAYEKEHIPTARSYPSSEAGNRLNEIPKDQYLIFYCETGGRAQNVIERHFLPNGYTRLMNWGGFSRWKKAFK